MPKFSFCHNLQDCINNRGAYGRLRKVLGRLRDVSRRLAVWLAGWLAGCQPNMAQKTPACVLRTPAWLILNNITSGEIYLIGLEIRHRCFCGIFDICVCIHMCIYVLTYMYICMCTYKHIYVCILINMRVAGSRASGVTCSTGI